MNELNFIKKITIPVFLLWFVVCSFFIWKNFNAHKCDFSMRYAEATVLRMGYNPYDVWQGKFVVEGYKPMMWDKDALENRLADSVYAKHLSDTGSTPSGKIVQGYPPWEYMFILPFTYLPYQTGLECFALFFLVCFGVSLFLFYRFCKKHTANNGYVFTATTFAAFAVSYPFVFGFNCGQWTAAVLLAIIGMIYCLETKHDYFAGLCWAVAMLKPHFAVLFFIPLLLSRKWKTIATAVVFCFLLSISPAIMCKTSPVDMIVQVMIFGVPIFQGNGFVPWPIYAVLNDKLQWLAFPKFILATGMAAGLILCAWVSNKLKNESWMRKLSAVTVISLAWTYSHASDFVFFVLPLSFVLLCALNRDCNPRKTGISLRFVIVTAIIVFLNCLTYETPRYHFEAFFRLPSGIIVMPLNLARSVLIPASWVLLLWILVKHSNGDSDCDGELHAK